MREDRLSGSNEDQSRFPVAAQGAPHGQASPMTEDTSRPDVASLLQALREHIGDVPGEARLRDADLTQRLSDRAVPLPDLPQAQPDISSLFQKLREHAEQAANEVHIKDIGIVQRIGDGVATLSGLPSACTEELVTFPTGVQGMILNLDRDSIDVILLGPAEGTRGGDLVAMTGERLRVPVGLHLLGRVVNALGKPLDGEGPTDTGESCHLDRDPPSIIDRAPVDQPMHTGMKMIDALVPVGRGQRQLILGDRQTGKTTLAVDAILNQRANDVVCVYVAIGQKKSSTLAVIEMLRNRGALPNTIVVMSSPDDPPSLRYLAPSTGCTMAEFLAHGGRDVLIVYDDLSKHADAYRELSLLLRRPPGREAYPGDIHYLQARLLERACKLSDKAGGGSLTALPIAETQRGNVVAYIPTNLISATDMRILLDSDLFNRGIMPAIDVGLSVSRGAGIAQSEALRAVALRLRVQLAQYQDVARFARFGIEVDETTRRRIRRGEHLRAVLEQPAHRPLPQAAVVIVLLAAAEGLLDDVAVGAMPAFESALMSWFENRHAGLWRQIDRTGELSGEVRATLMTEICEFREIWAAKVPV